MRGAPLCVLALIAAGGCGRGGVSPAPSPSSAPVAARAAPQLRIPSEQEIGLEFYPGSKAVSGTVANQSMSVELRSSDPVDKVAAFYEKALGAKAERKAGLAAIEALREEKSVAVAITREGAETSISILTDETKGKRP